MSLTLQIFAAVLLDAALGDPRWIPHPVQFIGRLGGALEGPLRRAIPSARAAGVAQLVLVMFVHVPVK